MTHCKNKTVGYVALNINEIKIYNILEHLLYDEYLKQYKKQ